MARVILAIALTVTLGPAALPQQPSSTPANAGLAQSSVDRLFAQWDKPETPGCALAVIKDGQIIYKRGYGSANLELSVPITSSSVFNVGSIAKQFTAMTILMLAQQGKLSLDDDVRKYVPEVPDFGTPITLRHLLHHTSGLRDFLEMLEMKGWRTGGDVTTEKDILDTVSRQRTLNHRPGDDHRTIIKGLVDGYLPRKGGGFLKWMPASDYIGSSNLFTTIEDLARWDQNFYDKKVAGAAVIEQMLTPGTLNDGVKLEYAGGLFITSYKGLKTVFHSGSSLGYQGTLHRFPDQHFSVSILCNVRGNNPDALARSVADIYLRDQFKQTVVSQGEPITAPADGIKLSEKELSRVTGHPVADTVRRVYMKDGKVMYFRAPGKRERVSAARPKPLSHARGKKQSGNKFSVNAPWRTGADGFFRSREEAQQLSCQKLRTS